MGTPPHHTWQKNCLLYTFPKSSSFTTFFNFTPMGRSSHQRKFKRLNLPSIPSSEARTFFSWCWDDSQSCHTTGSITKQEGAAVSAPIVRWLNITDSYSLVRVAMSVRQAHHFSLDAVRASIYKPEGKLRCARVRTRKDGRFPFVNCHIFRALDDFNYC